MSAPNGDSDRSTAGQSYGWRASRPVGRVLCTRVSGPTAIHLGLPLPAASCGLPASIGRAALERSRRRRSHWFRFPLGLAPGGVYRAAAVTCGAGGLLHHRFTLTSADAEAVCFLWHCPAGHPGSALPTTLPCGARTFLTAHRAARPPGRLARHRKDTASSSPPGCLPAATARGRPPGSSARRLRAEKLGRGPRLLSTSGVSRRRHLERGCQRRYRSPGQPPSTTS